jgi:hypothetical protein
LGWAFVLVRMLESVCVPLIDATSLSLSPSQPRQTVVSFEYFITRETWKSLKKKFICHRPLFFFILWNGDNQNTIVKILCATSSSLFSYCVLLTLFECQAAAVDVNRELQTGL